MLQTVTKFVEERFDFAESHEGGLFSDRGTTVASQVGHGSVTSNCFRFADADIHPSTTALVFGSGVGIQKEAGNVLAGVNICHLEESNVLIPDFGFSVGSSHFNLKDTLHKGEHTIQNSRKSKVGTSFFFGQVELAFLQTFTPESHVPRSELFQVLFAVGIATVGTGIGRQFFQFLFGGGEGLFGDQISQFADAVDGRSHFGGQTELCVVGKPQHVRHFLFQLQNFVNCWNVVLVATG
mmetsp:Transcript_31428/g.65610  ORF Transcript_31428/g.65610 Transcript_31428/m.65610 type:complete len:238 (-) Transcript_31428:1147-1860(-)